MSFWDRAVNGAAPAPAPAAPATAPPRQQPWWQDGVREPAPQYQQPQQQQWTTAPDGQQLAVANYGASNDPTVDRIATHGYIRKPPEWVRNQPSLYCPECQGVNYQEKSGRCFDCGYTSRGLGDRQLIGGRLNEYSGVTGGGPVVGGARQTTEGGASIRNFGEIK